MTKYIYSFIVTITISLFSFSQVTDVKSVAFTVADLTKEVQFFQTVLQFKKVNEFALDAKTSLALFGVKTKQTKIAVLQLGDETIQLMQFEGVQNKPFPTDSKSNDLWFQHIAIVVSDMDKAYQIIKDNDLQFVSSSPQTLPNYLPNAAGISAFYFQDPEGHVLELIHFPKDKGNPKWQKTTEKLFLGIDHSAIGIDKTTKSLPFYTQILGLQVGGNSENYGTEQEHLNQVFGAHLLITGLHANTGFGVEFLDYLAPQGGKLYPQESAPTDLWHWNYIMKANNLEKIYTDLKAKEYKLISNGIVNLKISETEISGKALLVRDPDGHAILIYQN
ncbi:VOC family protein [Flavobacterium muglaense]|uniref:VOC family protein n=1 Tax=Flavobacterium muglaense TaxID=2764716 RepID=A0A923N3F2_9FLAO|nr:VOC family protein [Flavobacterium muglaense]MBC5838842.1 VOC family protein [Flavobacterium muglaense]MBC5845345.1 VOC family protein [Flavobacterium muglaense]